MPLCLIQGLYFGDTMYKSVVKLRCRGNTLFKVLFIGNELIVVRDSSGKEYCVQKENVIWEEEEQ